MTNESRRDVLKGLVGGSVALAATQVAAQTPAPRPAGPPPREWVDPKTGHRIVRLSPDGGGGKLYFYKNSFSPQGDLMAMSVPEGIAVVDLKTRKLRTLVADTRAELMFTARRSRTLFYSISDPGEAQPMDRARTIFAVDIDSGKARQVARMPNGVINSLNADDTLMLGFVAYGSQPLQPGVADVRNRKFDQAEYAATGPDGKPLNFAKAKGVRMLQRWAARYPMEIFVLDLKTGQRRVIHKTNEWIGHTQFSPTDPSRIIFCHEGPWDRVDRMWTMRIDGSDLRRTHDRTMNFEIFGHEWFGADGREVFYDLQTPRGQVFWVASVDLAMGKRVYRLVDRDDWGVHFNRSMDGKLFASDGGDADMVAHAQDGKWLSLLRPEPVPDAEPENYRGDLITCEVMRRERLVDLSAHDYRLEPNLTFTPDGQWIVFVSNMHGANHVYAVEVAKA
ncbi:oligogalacturonate lyase family protein [uncultured Sphingomonas sp.]|uniref:oligogalacturonate lyase family protein n=1 Tax=uncultured Sphingomonas sp. TaxID=158754 RepID=UPI0025CD36FC|nr:oligogalacturonate lyase family protein [uncultured Sphingomonas sp.]